MLSSASLASVARLTAQVFGAQIQILRASPTSNQIGGFSVAWPVVNTLPGRLRKTRGQDYLQDVANQQQSVVPWHVLLPIGADVRPGDRLQVAGLILDVIGADSGRTNALTTIAQCQNVK